ncbi:fimbrial biogenesis chaperone [Noviherbaspirillum agri]
MRLLFRLAVALFMATGRAAFALSIAPTAVMLDGTQSETARLHVAAPATSALALEFYLLERHGEEDDERIEPVTDPVFEVHPPQLFLAAGSASNVALHLRTPHTGPATRSFYLVIEELDLTGLSAPVSELRVRTRMFVPVHLGKGQPILRVQRGAGTVELHNAGNGYLRFADPNVQHLFEQAGIPLSALNAFSARELARAAGADALLPGRRLALPLGSPDPLSASSLAGAATP